MKVPEWALPPKRASRARRCPHCGKMPYTDKAVAKHYAKSQDSRETGRKFGLTASTVLKIVRSEGGVVQAPGHHGKWKGRYVMGEP